MLSYQHIFHAGNHADLLKHTVLIQVLKALNKKDKPYTFFDTHSGSGLYDLTDNRSLKTGEAEKGILSFDASEVVPSAFADYLSFVKTYLSDSRYPGSPEIERRLMRPHSTRFSMIISLISASFSSDRRLRNSTSNDGANGCSIWNP